MTESYRQYKFKKLSKETQSQSYKRNLYKLLTGPSGSTHCANGHKHTLENCWAKKGNIYCRICEKSEKDATSQNAATTREHSSTTASG